MKVIFLISYILLPIAYLFSQQIPLTPFEISNGMHTTTYDECISYYKVLDSMYDEIKMFECGPTDIGKPLNLVVVSSDKDFDPVSLHSRNKEIILINNGIHPGEPDGIDASMLLVRDLMQKPELHKLLNNVVIIIIPIYNIDGALNHNSTSRVNQNGPESFGFRGNAENLDLNRDFIKCDSKNARSFEGIFQKWKPGLLIDNHVSDGADYQYILTYFATQHNQLDYPLEALLTKNILPKLKKELDNKGIINCPYVNEYKGTPDSGIVGFYDSPRYCTGYASLFNCIGFCVETHMLKSFNKRVIATYDFMKIFINVISNDSNKILGYRNTTYNFTYRPYPMALSWKLDTTRFDTIEFRGFQAKLKQSEVSGQQRLYYNEKSPYTKDIKYYNYYLPNKKINRAYYRIIPQAWYKVIDLLKLNGIELKRLSKDTAFSVMSYYIKDFETVKRPYEGHYLHYNTKVDSSIQIIQYYKGDYVIDHAQLGEKYIVATLEPEAPDSYFNWNFFDAILMQKEWYSDYVFEDVAAELLKNDKSLRDSLNTSVARDSKLATDGSAQLEWVYHHSKYYEKSHNRYPVSKLIEYIALPLED